MQQRKYRSDIDGLRAFAVLAVVGFHAFPTVFRGGFIGVDVFFVISGFLISGILFHERKQGGIRINEFYARRIKRIFPALIVVMLTTLALGWAVLFRSELRNLGGHVLAGAGFVSNLQSWSEAGYFDRAAASKPLLHLWSLGIEEQFYIVWPLAIMFLPPRRLIIVILLAASFGTNLWLVAAAPSTAFYLPVSRFWELLAGALLALPRPEIKKAATAVPWLGMLLIAAAVVFLDRDRAFPGWCAVLPVAGACCLLSTPGAWPNRRLLSHSATVFIGLISYPLYLWHWPLLTFARLIAQGTPPLETRLLVVGMSGLLAWVTYRFIERPVRSSSGSFVPVALGFAMILVAAAGLQFHRLPDSADPVLASIKVGGGIEGLTTFRCGLAGANPANKAPGYCESDARQAPVFALVGDSHAGALFPAVVRESVPGRRWMLLGRPGCLPVSGVVRITSISGDDGRECAVDTANVIEAVAANPNIEMVAIVVSARMTGTLTPELSEGHAIEYARSRGEPAERELVAEGLTATIATFEREGKRVVFVVDNPSLPDPLDCLRRLSGLGPALNPACSITRGQADGDFAGYRALIAALRHRDARLMVFDPTELLCPDGRCRVFNHGKSYYSYSDHLSDAGGTIVARGLTDFLRNSPR